ncbi:hypothetical protein UlMin_021388 [Ulmus minor]
MLYPGTKPQEHPFLFQDGLARSRSDDRHFSSWEAMNRASRARKTAQNYANQIGDQDDHSSGFCSPPLWKTSPSSSPPHERSHYRSLSPASKAQAIAKGQRELMDMVKNMPESCYELSLRDLVEQPAMLVQTNQTEQDSQRDYQKKRINVNKNNSMKQGQGLRRSGTMDNHNGGFLLKMFFPVSFWSKKKKGTKKNESLASNSSAKVSPKPPLVSGEGPRGVDKEWWKKGFSVTSGDNSETDQSSSINSGSMKSSISSSRSSSRSSTRQGSGGCWWFMGKRKSKNAE